ncbi:MAG TPA: sulfatase [Polyangia bacterium]|nr:sulfatase [Polyangia bacterium]
MIRQRINPRSACFALVVAAALACGREEPAPGSTAPSPAPAQPAQAPRARPDAPHLVLVVLDTVRRDHLSLHGYPRPTSRSLEALAARGTRFDAALANAAWTHPSHASMLSGLHTSEHGARYAGRAGDPQQAILKPRHARFLQHLLAKAGYSTIAAVGAPVLAQGFGVTAGFEGFDGALPDAEPSAFEVNERLLARVDRVEKGLPLFLLVNYFDAHGPYVARPEHGPWLADGKGRRIVDFVRKVDGLPRFARIAAGLETVAGDERRAAIDNYDCGIARADAGLGALLDGLRERGILDNALLVVTSDHGEYFGEHGLYDHGRTLHRELLEVPLVVAGPGVKAGAVVAGPVQLIDLFATFLEAAGLPAPDWNRGRSLWPLLAGREGWSPRPVLAEAFADPAVSGAATVYGRDYRAIRRGDLALIAGGDGSRALYDYAADPGAANDLSASRPDVAEELGRELESSLPPTAAGAGADLTDDQRRQLEKLGYLR